MAISQEAKRRIELALNSQPAVKALFGTLLGVRFSAVDPNCNLLGFLESSSPILKFWEERCEVFLHVVENSAAAVSKMMAELEGPARKNSPNEFNARLGDFFLEVCVVHDLAKRGCYKFVPLVPSKLGNKTISSPDYRFFLRDDDGQERLAYVEVKNLRAPVGVLDSFRRLVAELSTTHPHLKHSRIVIRHYWDNTALCEQDSEICEFLLSLDNVPIPYSTNLILPGEVELQIDVQSGSGDVVLTRAVGGDHPWGPFTQPEGLLNKATAHIRKAINQLSQYPEAIRIVAINVESPDGEFSTDIGLELQHLVDRESQGKVECILFHHHRFLEC